jgi:hypothetical protein
MTAVGDRVELVRCTDEYTLLVPGERGTVSFVNANSIGTTVFVRWDSGSRLGLILGVDEWRAVDNDDKRRT